MLYLVIALSVINLFLVFTLYRAKKHTGIILSEIVNCMKATNEEYQKVFNSILDCLCVVNSICAENEAKIETLGNLAAKKCQKAPESQGGPESLGSVIKEDTPKEDTPKEDGQ